MKPFKTNKKDREAFAKFLWLHRDEDDFRDEILLDRNGNRIFGNIGKNRWMFYYNGFQWVIAELVRRGIYPDFLPDSFSMGKHSFRYCLTEGKGSSVGEQLFRAVAALAREGK